MSEFFSIAIESIPSQVFTHGIKILAVIVISYFAHRFALLFITNIVRRAVTPGHFSTKEDEKKREDTLIQIFSATFSVTIFVVAVLMILQEIGVEIAPLLAAAGIAGIALGFGGQYLIRDLISGLFIIMENQYRIGDVVCFDDTCGSVEDLTMRMTTLRDLDGVVHHVPHGEIKKVSNMSKYFARVNLNVGVAYHSNLDHVIDVVNKVGSELAEDSYWKEHIIKAPRFLRVSDFADSSIIIKILGDTMPLKQWDVAGELRKRLKIAFDKEGIEIPFPQRVVHQSQR